MFMVEIAIHEKLECGFEGDGCGDRGGACLETEWWLLVDALVEMNSLDHIAAALVGGHRFEEGIFAIKDANAGGAVAFVAGECVEVDIESLHVDREVGGSLGAIDDDDGSFGVGGGGDLVDRVDGAGDVGGVADSDDFGMGGDEVRRPVECAAVSDGDGAEASAYLLAEKLPGDEVRVVLHLGDEYLIAGEEDRAAVGEGDEIERIGSPFGEDDLITAGGVEEALSGASGLVVLLCGEKGGAVDGAMDGGALFVVVALERVDDRTRFLARSGRVEIDQIRVVLEEGKELFHSVSK